MILKAEECLQLVKDEHSDLLSPNQAHQGDSGKRGAEENAHGASYELKAG